MKFKIQQYQTDAVEQTMSINKALSTAYFNKAFIRL